MHSRYYQDGYVAQGWPPLTSALIEMWQTDSPTVWPPAVQHCARHTRCTVCRPTKCQRYEETWPEKKHVWHYFKDLFHSATWKCFSCWMKFVVLLPLKAVVLNSGRLNSDNFMHYCRLSSSDGTETKQFSTMDEAATFLGTGFGSPPSLCCYLTCALRQPTLSSVELWFGSNRFLWKCTILNGKDEIIDKINLLPSCTCNCVDLGGKKKREIKWANLL